MNCNLAAVVRIKAIASHLEKVEESKELAIELRQIAEYLEKNGATSSYQKRLGECIEKIIRLAPGIAALIEFIRKLHDG